MGHFDSVIPNPRPDLRPLPGTIPLTPLAAALPPVLYYFALVLLPPFPDGSSRILKTLQSLIPFARNALALLSAILFFRLPLAYHVPFSIGLTYQLSLVGVYGGCRVVDVFFISLYLFNHIPRRVKYHHAPRDEDDDNNDGNEHHDDDGDILAPPTIDDNTVSAAKGPSKPQPLSKRRQRSLSQSYFSLHFLRTAGLGPAVTETATTAPTSYPCSTRDRLSFALELELSMRGAGFTWTSADVRHTKRTWRPSPRDRVHSILVHVLPAGLLCWAVVRDVWVHYLSPPDSVPFDEMPLFGVQLPLTAALGGVLLCAFSLGHSLFAIACHALLPEGHPLVYFPPLYSVRVWEVQSVRGFWAYGWHRLFSRLFLVYGVWPGAWVQRKVVSWMGRGRGRGKGVAGEADADVGKVLGGFCCSAAVHAFAGHAVLGGWRNGAGGEAVFFVENGVAVVVEEAVKRWVRRWRKGEDGKGLEERWYDGIVGRVWWISVLLFTGRNFARGWTQAGLVAEMAGG